MGAELLIDRNEFKRRLALPLDEKIQWAIERYIDFVEVYSKNGVYVSFSGGKDSQVLADIITRLHKGEMCQYLTNEYEFLYRMFVRDQAPPPLVFCDTGLEFPEIRKHVLKFDNLVRLLPKRKWRDVVENVGFLIGGKKISRMVNDIRNPTANNVASRNLYLTGMKRDGTKSAGSFKLPKMWRKLIDAPFNVSSKCCDIFKKEPFHRYQAQTGRMPISGTNAMESAMRQISYLKTGCNSFGEKAMSRPLSIWTAEDTWNYHDKFNIRFAEVYYKRTVSVTDIDNSVRQIEVDGEERTGCMFCMIGHPKQIGERLDRLSLTHPGQHKAMMEAAGVRKVLEYLGINNLFTR